jgi:hypothetical protein
MKELKKIRLHSSCFELSASVNTWGNIFKIKFRPIYEVPICNVCIYERHRQTSEGRTSGNIYDVPETLAQTISKHFSLFTGLTIGT